MTDHSNPAPASGPKSGSPVRLIVLIGVLLLAVGGLAYDFYVAGPNSERAYEEIEKMSQAKNEMSISAGGIVKSDDVIKVVGFSPTYTQKEKDYTIEWYCWWGKIPVLTTWKRYITVVYGPSGTFVSHHKNEPPAAESLGTYEATDLSGMEVPPGNTPAAQSTDSAAGGEGQEGKKGKGGKGKRPDADASAAEDATTEAPKDDAAAADAKPTEDKPAEDKPAEAPKSEDASKADDAPKGDDKPAAADPKSDE
jgi:hypothetical protein